MREKITSLKDNEMKTFDKKLNESGCMPLQAEKITILLVHAGYKCNLKCTHCYVDSSPAREEMMGRETMDKIIDIMRRHDEITTLDLTGGAPELNPHYKYFVKSASDLGKKVQVRSNLVIYFEPGMEDLPEFLAENRIKIFGSLPHYTAEIMDKQRGKGSHERAIKALKILNKLGYGREGSFLELDLTYNPRKIEMVPDQGTLEKEFKKNLQELYGITFHKLFAFNNFPVGKIRNSISEDEYNDYLNELGSRFNPAAVTECSFYLSISPSGRLYDCSCSQVLNVPLSDGLLNVDDFDYNSLSRRRINTHPVCFVCKAENGVNCFE